MCQRAELAWRFPLRLSRCRSCLPLVVNAAHPGGAPPAGQTYHAAGSTEGGWLVVSVWDSKDECDRFVHETLMPTLTSVPGGLSGPAQERAAEVENLITA
jgi:hypothetical protein